MSLLDAKIRHLRFDFAYYCVILAKRTHFVRNRGRAVALRKVFNKPAGDDPHHNIGGVRVPPSNVKPDLNT
jgi:hypothetical protein